MAKNRFGEQPGKALLRSQGRTVAGVARGIGVKATHLKMTLDGFTPPSNEVRERLPKFIGCDLSDLYTADALAATFTATNTYAAKKAGER